MSESIQRKYISAAIAQKVLPRDGHRMAQIISLVASNDGGKPIQFWQLYSVLGPQRIQAILKNFYSRVFEDEDWFRAVFARVGNVDHHIRTQSSMWIDVMGGGHAYHGAEFRLNFHHTHNALQVMNDQGAARWVKLMVDALDASGAHMTDDPRVRPAINTFLSFFFDKYADDFNFSKVRAFGEVNPPVLRKINFMNMTTQAIEALSEQDLREALTGRGVDVSDYTSKQSLVNKALQL